MTLVALREHHRHERLDSVDHAPHVHAEQPLPIAKRVLPEGAAHAHTGVVAQDVDSAELLLRCIGEGLDILAQETSVCTAATAPGLFATDASLKEMRSWLDRMGYRAYGSGIGVNARCPERPVDMLVETVDRVYAATGMKVTLIGHSLGGLLARGAALRRPSKVAGVVTLGSPVNGIAAHPLIVAAAEAARGACDGECIAELQSALEPNIAETNVYSKQDGVVDWRTCKREDAVNVEARGTHVGLVFNASVYTAIAASLARGQRQEKVPTLRLVKGTAAIDSRRPA